LDDAERKCAFGACDRREIDRLRKECFETEGGHEQGIVGRRDDRGDVNSKVWAGFLAVPADLSARD
jgi:hypothetical protein